MRKGGESPPKSWTEEQASQEGPPFPVIMKKSRSVMTVTADENVKDYLECGLSKSYSSSSNTLGIDLWRGRRCCSGNLQLPPLSQRQSERARTPDGDSISRPTTLPLLTLPSIAITTVSQERSCEGAPTSQPLRCPHSESSSPSHSCP
uniref:cAMP-specific 3',5'-cyclic phosphodiesterase 4B n=1 Tax=Sarcophilus harrisii TaxID=9305 RepID=A0A7N4PIW8_SARHA